MFFFVVEVCEDGLRGGKEGDWEMGVGKVICSCDAVGHVVCLLINGESVLAMSLKGEMEMTQWKWWLALCIIKYALSQMIHSLHDVLQMHKVHRCVKYLDKTLMTEPASQMLRGEPVTHANQGIDLL